MGKINIKEIAKRTIRDYAIYIVSVLLLGYLLISLYFVNHFYFNTFINGVDVSLNAHKDVEKMIKNYVQDYTLQIDERNGVKEEISSLEIGMRYNEKTAFSNIFKNQLSLN
ncbi:MAG: ErfK/YbiS/YcfS/YnhG family protein, partial [Anaerocolumna sp.]|nr:ErfK/YbiS/YcfS/YnhG family protein [Anaerocolumna sp.]